MGGKVSKYILGIILCVMISFSYVQKIYSNSNKHEGFNVLILNSYHQGHYWESNILDGIRKYMEKYKEDNINFNVEYLDFRNKNDIEYIDSLKEMLNKKYHKGSIDVIYTVDDEAYKSFKGEIFNKESSFYKVPLVFSGVDNKQRCCKKEKKYMSGIYHTDDSKNLIAMIKRLNPDVKNINVITEESLYCKSVREEIDDAIKIYSDNTINIRHIQSDYIQEVVDSLKKIDNSDNAVNIIAGEFQCKSSLKYLNPNETIKIIKQYSKNPIYSNDQTYINSSILGGCIDIGQDQAARIGEMVLKIKNGKPIYSIPYEIEPVAKEYIDYNSVYEYNINPFNISKSSKIINKKNYQLLLPIWMKYLIIIVIFFIIISIILCFSHVVRCKKNRKKREEEYNKAKERDKLKTDFIINLSHELRTPINIILGTTKVLERSILNENVNKLDTVNKLNNINQNSYRLLKISNNIIDITKVESGMFNLKLQNCNIVDVVEEIFTSSIKFANKKNLKMIFDTDEEEIITAIDKFQMQRVILNLLSNAIKFTNSKGYIYVYIKKEYKNVIIEVKDSGTGIPEDKINKIFYMFYQLDSLMTRKSEGSGIGLCIVKDIVEIHGGKIEVESKVNLGTTFRICIPIKIVEDETCDDNLHILDIESVVNLEMSDI